MIMKEWIKMKLEKKVRHDESKTKILREQQHNDASQSMVGESWNHSIVGESLDHPIVRESSDHPITRESLDHPISREPSEHPIEGNINNS